MLKRTKEEPTIITGPGFASPSRRKFLMYAGVAVVGTSMLSYGCKKDDDDIDPDAVDLGSGDIGILNYAYALEQLEAAFYTQVMATPYAAMTNTEREILGDIKNHEVVHVDFFKAALGANAIPGLMVNFESIDFTSRTSVLSTAKVFEDLGVGAYNGAGKLISDPTYLLLAGKIVSVEARHAAAIRRLIDADPTSFAGDDVIDANGLDRALSPSAVLNAAKDFLVTKVSGSNLPQ